MAKMLVLYPQPADPVHFDKHFRSVHLPLVQQMPGLRSFSFGPTSGLDGLPGAFFWCFIGTFDSREAILEAFGTSAGQAAIADIPNYSPVGPTILYLEETSG